MLAGVVGNAPIGLATELSAKSEIVSVLVDTAKVIRLPEKTKTIIVGNPAIADIAPGAKGIAILTGKSFGITNIIALDANGSMIAESTISVQAPQQAMIVTVQLGADVRNSYTCTPKCQPTAQLGDSSQWFGEVSSQADKRRSSALGSAVPMNAGGSIPDNALSVRSGMPATIEQNAASGQ